MHQNKTKEYNAALYITNKIIYTLSKGGNKYFNLTHTVLTSV